MKPNNQPFDNNFEVFLADTPESKRLHYNLRYQVYCEEMGFEDKDRFPDQLESDEWDDCSVHFLVKHKISGDWLGGLRLVFSHNGLFPFEEWSPPCPNVAKLNRQTSVEISRLCIIKEARRFPSKRFAPYGLPDDEHSVDDRTVKSLFDFKNQSRSLMWGLIRAAGTYSVQNQITHWYFVVTPALACFLAKGGLSLKQIGESCEHRGLRIPYRLAVDNVLDCPLWLNDYKKDFRGYSELMDRSSDKRRLPW